MKNQQLTDGILHLFHFNFGGFMNKDTLEGKWHEIKGKIKTKWGKLTDDDIAQVNGKREELLGKIQKRYGYAKDKAEEELSSFEKSCGCTCSSSQTRNINKEKDFANASKGQYDSHGNHNDFHNKSH